MLSSVATNAGRPPVRESGGPWPAVRGARSARGDFFYVRGLGPAMSDNHREGAAATLVSTARYLLPGGLAEKPLPRRGGRGSSVTTCRRPLSCAPGALMNVGAPSPMLVKRCPGNQGVHPSPRTTNSTHSSELPRSLWCTPGVSPNSRVHTHATSGPPPGPVIDHFGGVGEQYTFTQTGVGLARSPQPPDARSAAFHWPRVPGGTNEQRGAHGGTPLGR